MVGIFSRFSGRGSHRRTQSALDEMGVLPSSSDATTSAILSTATSAVPHGIELAFEFKPVEHPSEPLDSDQPILCPQPEPSILNDGRIWKERASSGSGVSRRAETPVLQEQISIEPEIPRTKPRPPRRILPSMSAPEHNILKLLEECNASGISFNT
ncbi:uncharacterized protein LOC131024603 [Salvia miltiorrhiza]|uniref:uncharacterized protein LOC131024603 n=1 Tax=Salvia miltiorrhiza TaxID=226208 RepID=UPI0025AD0856|nr:uncharacterized protein LOC131024603 [Salvia miltiorrhiza]XP_057810095.1 uncharacterized protein LOC131024603 [Salvia miltiorrhiza]